MILSFEFSKKDVRFLDPREDGSEFDSWENPLSALTPFLSPPQDSNLDVDWLETTLRSIDHPIDDSPLIQPDDNIRDIIRCFLPLFSNIRKRERESERDVLLYSKTGIIREFKVSSILLQRISSTLVNWLSLSFEPIWTWFQLVTNR